MSIRSALIISLLISYAASADRVQIPLPVANGVAAVGGTIYVGGMNGGQIVAVEGEEVRLVTEGHPRLKSVAALRRDPRDATLWGTSPDAFGQRQADGTVSRAPSCVFQFDPVSGRYRRLVELPAGVFANDLGFGPDHTLYVTDSFGGKIWRLSPDAERFEVFLTHEGLGGEGLGVAGIAVASDGTLYLGTYTAGRLMRLRDGHLEALRLPRPLRNPDGIRVLPNGDLLVIEGNAAGRSGRLLRLRLDGLQAELIELAQIEMPLNLTLDGDRAVVTDAAARPWLVAFLSGDRVEPPATSRLIHVPLTTRRP
ncbi:MAG: hypothetical protein AAGE65_06575 [Planctomycetota bacterium]